jgi:glycosyltransferase involved in cell wall biosynthesis
VKILYSVQRYGEEIVGGSESACRQFAEALVRHGHTVDVLTSCAKSYVDWENYYPSGTTVVNGVTVHRLPVTKPRTPEEFDWLHTQIQRHPKTTPLFIQRQWANIVGPTLREHSQWLHQHAREYDAAVFMTYLYSTTTTGLPVLSNLIPTVFQPTAHEELMAYPTLFKTLYRLPDAFLFFTPEEKNVVQKLYDLDPLGEILGIGIKIDENKIQKTSLLNEFHLQSEEYLTYVGRIDPAKGVGELLRFFKAFKSRNQSDLKLVLVGEKAMDMGENHDVIYVGFLSEEDKETLLANSLALVQPSYFESFSIVLSEAWAQKRPALVQSRCEVLRGQVIRSGGGIPYSGFAEFEQSILTLQRDHDLADQLGSNGFDYVKSNYEWSVVIQKFENTLTLATNNFNKRRRSSTQLQLLQNPLGH